MLPIKPEQIQDEQLKLLQKEGHTLSEFKVQHSNNELFKRVKNKVWIDSLQKFIIKDNHSLGFTFNANLKGFACILLNSIFHDQFKEQLLEYVKTFVLSGAINLSKIRNKPNQNLKNQDMKKMLIEFFYTLVDSDFQNKVQIKLKQYPLIIQIIVLFLRCILKDFNVKNAENYLIQVNTDESFKCLNQFFDLNCKKKEKIYIYFEDKLFSYEDQNGEIIIGKYEENHYEEKQKEKRHHLRFFSKDSMESQPIQIDIESNECQNLSEDYFDENNSQIFEKKSRTFGNNKGLKLIKESIVLSDCQAPTPFFNDQNQLNQQLPSFHKIPEASQESSSNPGKLSFLRTQREFNLLKMKDSQQLQQFQRSNFGIKHSHQQIEFMQIQKQTMQNSSPTSPVTNDSPATIYSEDDGFIARNHISTKFNQMRNIKQLKKSRSEIGEQFEERSLGNYMAKTDYPMKKKKIHYTEDEDNSSQCTCSVQRKKKNEIISNTIQVTLMGKQIVTMKRPSRTGKIKTQQSEVKNFDKVCQEYISSKLVDFKLPTKNLIKNPELIKNNHHDFQNSYRNSRGMNNEDHYQTNRELSPLSNVSVGRSTSPLSVSGSVQPVKIKFSYKNIVDKPFQKNPMKHSAIEFTNLQSRF